ncbi:MAG: hypothetical protein EBX37_17900 [Alphaproteobacteria bacterium]|nr:hypothetical protein [Alphaproteobacteria bacterium]
MYQYDKPQDCPICTEALPSDCRPTKCGHYLHSECLSEWSKRSTLCPVCRTCISSHSKLQLVDESSSSNLIVEALFHIFIAAIHHQHTTDI